MITIRHGNERGHANFGWLDSHHTFSFGEYYDPRHMGFSNLRVINEDRVQPGMGFGMHSHRDMEIISYVLEGALEHKDTIGTNSVIRPGEVQRMSAGTGIAHSEFNPSQSEPVHFLQIWITPKYTGIKPSYEQKRFDDAEVRNQLRQVVSPDGRNGSITIHQDASLHVGKLDAGYSVEKAIDSTAYIMVARGEVEVNGKRLVAGDSAGLIEEASVRISALQPSEVLVFDLV